MGVFIGAPAFVEVDGPLVFLAGPVWWGPDAWHDRAASYLAALDPRIHVASPRRDREASARLWNPREDASARRADTAADFAETDYNLQMDWETRYLQRAAEHGVVMFWLAREREHRCERPHAQTTRFELGEWKQRHVHDGVKLVVGIEAGFTGERYIRRRFEQDCPRVPVRATLEEACGAAAELCNR
ncbi:MAG TPA: hypothetical protein VIV11_41160 [Kofleriaceae bacterium]